MNGHHWHTEVVHDVYLEERCAICAAIRWKAPADIDWYYEDGDGCWRKYAIQPECSVPARA